MSQAELKKIAARLAEQQLEATEFCWVYEDEECEDLDYEDQVAIFHMIMAARVQIG
ncbi:hypothetical protein L3Y25_gp129 [Gordonia phage Syleon]|uniref:Uncharacterized protein n=1 Tax=Gordonia phage Syleon TaxID=2653718 RepID=A0A5Q2WH43_9CAUD|nr:hypothetical protein L3Y25_gp129 [Gordonia phage Syleon]QGH75835.1 hypothetical protein SEA_SYLEON_112 [Gordonia phage Syleon]